MHNGYCFIFTKYTNITFLAVTTKNVNAMMTLTFLNHLKNILIEYFKTLEAESIKDNFIMIYELFDEIMDNGYPQTTEIKMLKKMIKTEHHELVRTNNRQQRRNEKAMMDATRKKHPWRPGTYKYSRNECYLDVIEKVNMLVSSSGQVIKSEVQGALQMKCHLSGTPDLILGLNDKKFFDMSGRTTRRRTVDIEDIKFHQCVALGRFENERTITFVPPDGQFNLITYRMESAYKPLFTVNVQHTKQSETRLEFTVKAKSHFRDRIVATFVEFYIPVPADSQNIKSKSTSGAIKYEPDKGCVKWRLKQLYGKKEVKMVCSLQMPVIKSGKNRIS